MESFNFINLNASVDNTATFAASSASSTALHGEVSGQAQQFKAANALTFNDHLNQSIEFSKVKSEDTTDDKTKALVEQLMRLLKSERSPKMSNDDISATKELEKSNPTDSLSNADSSDIDDTNNVLAKLEAIIASLTPSKSEQLSHALAEIKALNDEFNLEQQLEKLQSFNGELNDNDTLAIDELDSIINDVSNLLSTFESLQNRAKLNEKLSSEELATELAQLRARIESLNVDDVTLAEIKGNVEQLINVTNEYLSEAQDSTLENKLSQEVLPQTVMQSGAEVVQDTTISDNKELLSDKLQTLINELPDKQRQQLFNFISEKNEPIVVNSQSAKQMLAQIEGSRASLQQVNQTDAQIDESAKNAASVESSMEGADSDTVIAGRDNAVARLHNESEKKINVKTAPMTSEREFVKGDVVVEQDKPVPSKVDALVAQLESSFRNSSASMTPAESSVSGAARVEQQVAKEFASSQLTANKTPETLAQRITLNDNSMASQQLKEHMTMMARGGINHVVMNLDPEELGAMSVRIVMQQDQMNVQFQVSNPQAKDMLEQAMAKLKESLQEQGIELNQSDVKEQNQQQKDSQQAQQSNLFGEQGDFDGEDIEPVTLILNKQSANGIDYYA
ncbi:MAG: hypothetical protein BM565_03660 [Gammaproteobacteria bacterium MedPE]|nr:MAG: hypothetical protein BM565_03660 [Gammaproteobacteria bacterium MedPE]